MLKFSAALLLVAALLLTLAPSAPADTIAEKTKDAQKLPGYFNLYWDAKSGKLWLEIDKWNTEFLYQTSLPAGVGSNDIGLDRGQMGETRIVRFHNIYGPLGTYDGGREKSKRSSSGSRPIGWNAGSRQPAPSGRC